MRQSTLLTKDAQQILGQVENRTLVNDFVPGSNLWPQELVFKARTTRLSTFVPPFPELHCRAGKGALTPMLLPCSCVPQARLKWEAHGLNVK